MWRIDMADLSSLGEDKWNITCTDDDEFVIIEGGKLRAHSTGNGYAYVKSVTHFRKNNVTLLVDFSIKTNNGRAVDIRIDTVNDEGNYPRWVGIGYDADTYGWTPLYHQDGEEVSGGYSYVVNALTGVWYTANITVRWDRLDITISQRSDGKVIHSYKDIEIEPLHGDNRLHIGVYQFHETMDSDSYYDNLQLYSLDEPYNEPPVWSSIEPQHAVEEVPVTLDLSAYVYDPDGGPRPLEIVSSSPFVRSIEGHRVTFAFPEGVIEADVPLSVTDGRADASTGVPFVIEPTNDPPLVVFLSPPDGSVHELGSEVAFVLVATDPDLPPGRDLAIEVSSNISGLLWSHECGGEVEFRTDRLTLGTHRVVATTSDGEEDCTSWLDVTMVEEIVDPPRFQVSEGRMLLLLVVAVLALVAAHQALDGRQGRGQGP